MLYDGHLGSYNTGGDIEGQDGHMLFLQDTSKLVVDQEQDFTHFYKALYFFS